MAFAPMFQDGKWVFKDTQQINPLNTGGIANLSQFTFPTATTTLKPIDTTLTFDPALDASALLTSANEALNIAKQPIDQRVQSIISPQLPFIKKDVGDFLAAQQDRAKAESIRRNIAGSSTTDLQVRRDLPIAAADLLARAEADLTLKAIPLAQQEKQFESQTAFQKAQFGTSLRGIVSQEQFNKMNIEQRQNLAEADISLQKELNYIDRVFNAQVLIAQQRFQSAENEKTRQLYREQMNQVEQERKRARAGAFFKGLTTIGGSLIGAKLGGFKGAELGADIGYASGDMFGFMMS